ncbi:helix-turn-helix domain-containing protein [Streptomyces sp. NPDC001530]|uniref:helix-turn-helix domain-containing protein n=1 Tax=Streptomyces sp. NPDC001530 TaxID=3364582 RepID=UPI0036AA3D99
MKQDAGQESVPDHGSKEPMTEEAWAVELEQAPAFSAALGRRLQDLREAKQLTAEEMARSAQRLGLSWHRPTVGQIEKGKRGITAPELLLLPLLYGVPLAELLPEGAVWLTDQVAARREAILYLLDRGGSEMRWSAFQKPGHWHLKRDEDFSVEVMADLAARSLARWPMVADTRRDFWETPDEAEIKAAKRLDTTPEYVAYTARELWGRGLAAERDARLAERAELPESPRALQAARGHITRALLSELEPAIREHEKNRIDLDKGYRWVHRSEIEGEEPDHG